MGGRRSTIRMKRFGSAPALVHYNRGIDWYAKKELDKAISEYDEAIRLDPDSASAYCCRAPVWFEKKDLDKAIADFNEAIRLDPKHIWAFNNRGNGWAAKREFAKAIADYTEAIRLDPSFAMAYKNRAAIWATCPTETLRDGKQAVASAMRGCELTDWKDPTYLDTLAASYAEAGDFEAAVKTQAKAIALIKDFDARLKAYQDKTRYHGTVELDAHLSQSRPLVFSSQMKSQAFFIVPYDAMLSLTPVGGSGGAVTEFGLGKSEAKHIRVFTGLPADPQPNQEVKVGFVAAGSELHFYEKTDWGGTLAGRSLMTRNPRRRVSPSTIETTALGGMGRPSRRRVPRRGYCTWMMRRRSISTTMMEMSSSKSGLFRPSRLPSRSGPESGFRANAALRGFLAYIDI